MILLILACRGCRRSACKICSGWVTLAAEPSIAQAEIFQPVQPFAYGVPEFKLWPIWYNKVVINYCIYYRISKITYTFLSHL